MIRPSPDRVASSPSPVLVWRGGPGNVRHKTVTHGHIIKQLLLHPLQSDDYDVEWRMPINNNSSQRELSVSDEPSITKSASLLVNASHVTSCELYTHRYGKASNIVFFFTCVVFLADLAVNEVATPLEACPKG